MKFDYADMNKTERAIFGAAFVYSFFHVHLRSGDDDRARLAELDAQAMISLRRRAVTRDGDL